MMTRTFPASIERLSEEAEEEDRSGRGGGVGERTDDRYCRPRGRGRESPSLSPLSLTPGSARARNFG